MRWVVVFFVVAACKRGADTSTAPRPSLDIPQDAAAGPSTPKPPPTETLGLVFEAIDGPPVSAPVGAAVQLKFVPAAVGAKRTRTHIHVSLHHYLDHETKLDRLQEKQITFVMREEVQSVANNRVKRMGITVDQADELLVINGERHQMPLLQGVYTIDIGGQLPRDMKMRAVGRRMGTREEEELSMLMSGDAASTTPFHELVWQHPLRVGEAVVLTSDEMKTLLGDVVSPAVITYSLRKVEDGDATYQLDALLEQDNEKRLIRQRYKLRVATGQVLEVMDATHSIESSKYGSRETKNQTTMRFAW
jgi:hypothetical protein